MKIVCLGDSLTFGFGVRRSKSWCSIVGNETGIEIINRGVNGDTTSGMLDRLKKDVISENPNIVHIMGGTNDVLTTGDIEIAKGNIYTIVEQLLSKSIYPVISTPLPIYIDLVPDSWYKINRANDIVMLLEKHCENVRICSDFYNINLIDFNKYFSDDKIIKNKKVYFRDGIHLTSEGNKLFSELFMKHLESILNDL